MTSPSCVACTVIQGVLFEGRKIVRIGGRVEGFAVGAPTWRAGARMAATLLCHPISGRRSSSSPTAHPVRLRCRRPASGCATGLGRCVAGANDQLEDVLLGSFAEVDHLEGVFLADGRRWSKVLAPASSVWFRVTVSPSTVSTKLLALWVGSLGRMSARTAEARRDFHNVARHPLRFKRAGGLGGAGVVECQRDGGVLGRARAAGLRDAQHKQRNDNTNAQNPFGPLHSIPPVSLW